jgi:DNA-binding NarL/FixJ family response regulator
VARIYEHLWSTPPPRGTGEQRAATDAARAQAAAQGWQPPLAWDDIDTDLTPQPTAGTPLPGHVDDIAIERALAGDGIGYNNLTPAEQHEVIRQLTERGRSIRDIAAQLATTKRTVSRHRTPIDAVRSGR